ncbi:hypothetical protein LJC35_01745 [Parabacteroides sp. OttesenSCG-928-N08]|nr:hypothetical protein [Parabacteroides sp. OttesenSCG-928-N08]
MKRVLLVVALCVAASASFAQKKAVKQAESIAKSEKGDFNEARGLIKGALEDAESKDDPKTWYVAAFIEDQEFSKERTKELLGQKPNEAVMYKALLSELPYFLKSYELDNQPNEKGKVKPKLTKDIKGIISSNHVHYINAGAFYFEERDYKTAYDAFEQYAEIANHPMFAGEKVAEVDSSYMMVMFYAGVASTQLNDPEKAIAALTRACKYDFKREDSYQYLANEYLMKGDSLSYAKVMEEGAALFPHDDSFLLNLINYYIAANKNDMAIDALNKVIAEDPNNAQYYVVLGNLYEQGFNDATKAEEFYLKGLEIDPELPEGLSSLGRIYYNAAVNKLGEANLISDNKLYQEELAKAKEMFEKARPHFEKARQLKPDERDVLVALRGIYYNLNMGPEFEEIEAAMAQ